MACDSDVHQDYSLTRDIDVAFVGNFTEKRQKLFSSLKKSLPNLHWRICEKVYGEEMAKIYSRAKIVINPLAKKDVNMRTIEAMSGGALLLNEDNRSLRKLFEVGQDLDVYPENNLSVLIEKIKFYLSNEPLREKIAHSGKEKVLQEHTYTLRVKKMLAMVKEITPSLYSQARIILANTFVYGDRQFRMYGLAKKYFLQAFRKDWSMTLKVILRYLIYNSKEKIRKLLKIWPY